MRMLTSVAPVILLVLHAGAGSAQVVRGTVTDYSAGTPLPGVQIDLIDDVGSIVAQAATDSTGFFALRPPAPGVHLVRATLLGYHTVTSDAIELHPREIVEVGMQLSVDPVPLPPVVVVVRADASGLAEFEERRARGTAGRFVTRNEIERRPVATPSEMLIGMPAVVLSPVVHFGIPQDRYLIGFERGTRICLAHVFINGVRVPQSSSSPVDDLLFSDMIGGIEVYRSAAATPPEYRSADDCGTVLFWTRRAEGGNRWHWLKVAAAIAFLGVAAAVTR